jgi:regulator of sigma E protease
MLTAIIAGLVMLGVLVVVHEAGHMVVAKLFGIGVPVFSVGMGPRLFGIVWRGTDYRVSALPVGGYVRMAGADPFGEEDPDEYVAPEENFMNKPVWQRLLVMFAGPAANLILPFVVFTGVLMLGEPQPPNVVGYIQPNTIADELGLAVGDHIVDVGGEPAETWTDVLWALGSQRHDDVPITLERDGERIHVMLAAEKIPLTDDDKLQMGKIGMRVDRPSSRVGVSSLSSPAARAGLQTGDAVLAVDGVDISTWDELMAGLEAPGAHAIAFVRPRDGELQRHEVTMQTDPSWDAPSWEVNPFGLQQVQFYVGEVIEGSAAVEAGIQADDRLVSIDGEVLKSWGDIISLVQATVAELKEDAKPRALDLGLVRGGELIKLRFQPRMKRELIVADIRHRPMIGISQYDEAFVPQPDVVKYYGFTTAVPRAWDQGVAVFNATIKILGNLLTGRTNMKESVGGPIMIFSVAGQTAELGVFYFARLIGQFSFSLGIVNLLPVPVLDGGQICFYTVEWIRGRPLPLELRERVQMVGVLALVALMLVVAVIDVSRLLE